MQMGMQLFPPLLYRSYGSDQCSNVSISGKPSRNEERGRWWLKVSVKARVLLGRAFGRSVAMTALMWVSAWPHRTVSSSVVLTHGAGILTEGYFSFSWSSYLGATTKSSSWANQENNIWHASHSFNVHCWPEPSHAGTERFAPVVGMCFMLSTLLFCRSYTSIVQSLRK